MSEFFENLGHKLGRAAVPAFRKSKWVWDGLTGTEEEALQAERELGATMAAELRLVTDLIDDPATMEWLRNLCRELESVVGQPGFRIHCELIRSDQPTAIGLPGGYFFVSRSLIDFCQGSVHEMAFVLGHETAHVIRRHTWDRMLQQSALRAVSFVTARSGVLAGWLRQQGIPMLRSAHSEDCEFEADADGFGLVRMAGYDPQGAFSFLRRIEQAGPDPEVLGEYLASHPSPGERASRLRDGKH